MQKYILALLAVIVFFIGLAYFQLFSRQTSYQRSVLASTNGVLVLNNFDNGNVKIVTSKTDKISFDLQGTQDDLAGLNYESDGIYTKFGLSSDWAGISGTITVPEGILLDVTLSSAKDLLVEDGAGEKTISQKDSFLVDTNGLSTFGFDGEVFDLEGWGHLILWDDETWDVLTDDSQTASSGDPGSSENFEDEGVTYCGIGSQSIRNYCCETQNFGNAPVCSGTGYWIFDNSERECSFSCNVEEGSEELADCGVGAQAERNSCCAAQHSGEYGGCIGDWYYNNSQQNCAFQCSEESSSGGPPDGTSGDGSTSSDTIINYGDPVSNYCADITNVTDRDACCNDALKNPLSSGPRPGFPDCIGKWKFNSNLGCGFECAEHTEMMEILNEIKQNIQNQE